MNDQPWPDESARFPILNEMTFLNHAGVAPLSQPAADAITTYARNAARSAYIGGGWYRRALELKAAASRLLHARGAHEIAIVANTTSGLALVANGLDWREGDNVVITNVEYPANRYPWEDLKRKGVELREAKQLADGRIDVEDIIDLINDDTRVVAISHVQYASGFRIDLKAISDVVHAAGGYLCVDGIQSAGVLPVDVQAMGVDFLAADGHKWMLGPEGCGLFYCHEELIEMLRPTVAGWMCMTDAMDYGNYKFQLQKDGRRFEPGSYNIPGIMALAASLDLLLEVGIDEVWRRVEHLTSTLAGGLEGKGYAVFSPRATAEERSGIVVFQPPAELSAVESMKRIVGELEREHGIVIALREGRLRASPHFYNTPAQMERLVEALPVG